MVSPARNRRRSVCRAPKKPRNSKRGATFWVTETLIIILVSLLVLAVSRPAREEYSLCFGLVAMLLTWPLKIPLRQILVPTYISPTQWLMAALTSGLLGTTGGVFLTAHLLAATSGVRRFSFNAGLERRLGQTTRPALAAYAMPISFACALALPGIAGLYCVVVFTVLFSLIRLTRGEKQHVVPDPASKVDAHR